MYTFDTFEEKTQKGPLEDDCDIWIGAVTPEGYGKLTVNGKIMYAHRYSYTLSKGVIPEGMLIMHSCDTPACVNPRHLSVGTSQDNTTDMMQKGRHIGQGKGEKNLCAKLTEEIVHKIRKYRAEGASYAQTATEFNIPASTVGAIVTRATWKHI